METRTRSVSKALSWRLVASLATTALIYAFTGAAALSASIGAVDLLLKLLLYYLHERLWARVAWGRPGRIATTRTAASTWA